MNKNKMGLPNDIVNIVIKMLKRKRIKECNRIYCKTFISFDDYLRYYSSSYNINYRPLFIDCIYYRDIIVCFKTDKKQGKLPSNY